MILRLPHSIMCMLNEKRPQSCQGHLQESGGLSIACKGVTFAHVVFSAVASFKNGALSHKSRLVGPLEKNQKILRLLALIPKRQ